MPESRTQITAEQPLVSRRTSTVPGAGVYFTALSTKTVSSRCRALRSPRTVTGSLGTLRVKVRFHDLHGDEKVALANYFQRFPDLKNSRYYSVRVANTLMLVLDSSLDETSGPQGQWLTQALDTLSGDVDFVFLVLHHPPYTSSSDEKKYGGGHSARKPEHRLAEMLEARQQHTNARFVVFSGHVHNYERHEHGGVTYFVLGGAGAHAYPIERAAGDPFQSKEINYHYLLVEVDRRHLKFTMNRLDLSSGKVVWTQPDSLEITVPAPASARAGNDH